MKICHKSYSKKPHFIRYFLLIISVFTSFYYFNPSAIASGAYDNGTATGKENIGLDLTWNPFNYFPNGQSYIVLSYGFTNKFDFHSYYSHPTSGPDNYYFGIFYQFYNNRYLDLATALGIRQYRPKYQRHLFAPQLLYTLNLFHNLQLGGSLVAIRNIARNNTLLGTALDLALIIPIVKHNKLNGSVVESIKFCIGAFKPVLWKPINSVWHPTYSFDFRFKISN